MYLFARHCASFDVGSKRLERKNKQKRTKDKRVTKYQNNKGSEIEPESGETKHTAILCGKC